MIAILCKFLIFLYLLLKIDTRNTSYAKATFEFLCRCYDIGFDRIVTVPNVDISLYSFSANSSKSAY